MMTTQIENVILFAVFFSASKKTKVKSGGWSTHGADREVICYVRLNTFFSLGYFFFNFLKLDSSLCVGILKPIILFIGGRKVVCHIISMPNHKRQKSYEKRI